MAQAGYNLEEAHKIAVKIFDSYYINIESLKDDHVNDKTRVNAIDAMIIATKQRVIEDTERQVTTIKPLNTRIKELIACRPKTRLLSEKLYQDINNTSDSNVAIQIWLNAFYESICDYNGSLKITDDDIDALYSSIATICKQDKNKADNFFATILLDMEKHKNDTNFEQKKELMTTILHNFYTFDYSSTYVDADHTDSRTAEILRHYLTGFRESSGDNFDKMMQKFNYIKSFVATTYSDCYKGILIKNFNLLELDFNENDIGKHFSPEIINHIKQNINARENFETLSGLKINIAGNYLIIKNEKLSNCTIVNSKGIVEFSFPLENLDSMYTHLCAQSISHTYQDVISIINDENIPSNEKFNKLINAYRILDPQTTLNNLDKILKIKDNKEQKILLNDVMELLPENVQTFFAERNTRPYNLEAIPYTNFVVNNLAEYIKNAPKEEFDNILNYLTSRKQNIYCDGSEKLWNAFLENKDFFTITQTQIDGMSLEGKDFDTWFMELTSDEKSSQLTNIFHELQKITEHKLIKHLSSGKSIESFEAPYTKQIGELCGFSTGKFSKEELEESIRKSQKSKLHPSLLQEAYVIYYSYDTLKDGVQINLNKTFGTNCVGTKTQNVKYIISECIENPEKYNIDENELKLLKIQYETIDKAYNIIYQKLNEQIHNNENWSLLDGSVIFSSISYNSKSNCINTILENKEFLDLCLKFYPNDKDRHDCILALDTIVNSNDSTIENDKIKEQIFPIISSVFDRTDMDIYQKTETFHNLSKCTIFKSDNIDYYNLLIGPDGKSGLLQAISQANFKTQEQCYTLLLDKDARIPDPDIRAYIVKKLAIAIHNNLDQYDDRNPTTYTRDYIISKIKNIKDTHIPAMDKFELLKELSELMVSQRELSLALKPKETKLETSDKEAIIGAYGVDGIAYLINRHPNLKEQLQKFLLGYGTPDEAKKLEYELKYALCKEADDKYKYNLCEKFINGEDIGKELPYDTKTYYYKLSTENLKAFKKEFDASSLETKALILNEILTSGKQNWKSSFEIVSKQLFEGSGELAQMGSDFLYSYIDARPESEKTFYLAAMMAAANNKSKSSANQFIESPYTPEQRSLAKGLRMFLENSGPAGTKLAQAMASYSDVPDFIRFEMQFAKSQANPPARWEIFSENDRMSSEIMKQGPLGKRLGSASFFVTYEIGDKIVKILRRGAKTKADNEFKIYREMLTTLSNKYDNISSFKRLVDNAADNVIIETDLDIGYKQLLDAKKLYPEKVTTDKIEFNLDVKDWTERGKDWAILEKAQGIDFKDLTKPYKTAVAKAIFSTELANMLSGKCFDSDRHGGQYKIDPKTNTIGIFDTGSISTIEPTQKEQEVLGIVLARTLKSISKGSNIANAFSYEIDKATNEFYKSEISRNQTIPPYLSEFQRGLLALNDFYSDLSPKDLIECFTKSLNNGHHKIHPNIVNGFKNELIKNIPDKKNIVSNILSSENQDKLSPEARADRHIGMILFDAIYNATQHNTNFTLSDDLKSKLLPKLNSPSSSLQIVKGIVRGAWAKINPDNYSSQDKNQLGSLLYEVCAQDAMNKKLKKDVSIQEIFTQIEKKYPNQGEFCKNISSILKTISQISSLDSEQIKRAAIFIAFADKDVAKGYKKAALNDKSINLGKRLIRSLEPLNFVPPKAKKLLVKNVGKKMLINYVNQKIFGITVNTTNNQRL